MSARVPFRFSTILSILLALMLVTAGCLKSPDEKYADYMASGMEYMESGDYGAAMIEFKNAARTKSIAPFEFLNPVSRYRRAMVSAAESSPRSPSMMTS